MPLRRVPVSAGTIPSALAAAGGRSIEASPAVEAKVRDIVAAVRARGDAAVAELTLEIEGRAPTDGLSYEIPRAALEEAARSIDPEVHFSLERGAQRIRRFHELQVEPEYAIDHGALRLRVSPLARVGLYVPGGTALYPSSVLMTAVPAVVAGVREIIMVTPGASKETLAAAAIAGVTRVFEIGGAQAVAALAYGTESVPRVDKIVGPGNQWVAAAKRQVFGDVDIDSIAGPSEVLILADDSAVPAWVAADLLAQAEHDTEARPVLVTTSESLIDAVDGELARQLAVLPRRAIAEKAVERYGIAFLCESLEVAIALANEHAPEHLEVLTRDAEAVAAELDNAGAIFVGPYSPEAAGDYVAGPNHVLPTGGAARYASPLGVYDYRKRTSILAQSRELLAAQRDDIVRIAGVESLDAHARSVEIRFAETEDVPSEAAPGAPLAERLLRASLAQIAPYHVEHPQGIRVQLHANEMPFALPPAIASGLATFLAEVALHRYPDPRAQGLREVMSRWLGVDGERLVFGNGSDELIALLCATFAEPRGGASSACVVFPTPTFSVFRVAALAAGVRPIEVPLAARFELDAGAMDAAIRAHRPNLVFLARPNNPTGTLWPRQAIARLAQQHPETLFVIDEAYIAYGGDSMKDEVADNLAVMGTLSKVGLASARVGFLYGTPAVVGALERARAPYNIGGLNQAAAEYLLREHAEWIAERSAEVAAERERVANALAAHPSIEVLPSSANLLLLCLGAGRAHQIWSALADRGILVRDLDRPGPTAGCLRVTIGTRADNDAFLSALAAILG